jgi:hypothetical protein
MPLAATIAPRAIGTLVRGLGTDRVLWGTDSVWYGSPQWQVEAMRRLEIPEAMRKKHDFAPLGAADGLVKTAIFSSNAARLYGIRTRTAQGAITNDRLAAIRAEYVAAGGVPSNVRYGYVEEKQHYRPSPRAPPPRVPRPAALKAHLRMPDPRWSRRHS